MPAHHLKLLGRHRANYNMQETVLAQLLYHVDTAHTNVVVSRVGTTLVHHLQSWPSISPTSVQETTLCLYYATCTLTNLHSDRRQPLSCNRNKALAQRRQRYYFILGTRR